MDLILALVIVYLLWTNFKINFDVTINNKHYHVSNDKKKKVGRPKKK